MTNKRAKFLINAVGLNIDEYELHDKTLAFINTALDKQIAVAPSTYEYKRDKYAYICTCGKEVYHGQKYCDECGQALKWSDAAEVTEICL